jgi:hypothetical protein
VWVIARSSIARWHRSIGLVAVALLGCARSPTTSSTPESTTTAIIETEAARRARILRQLRSDVLADYTADDGLAFETTLIQHALIDPAIGPARIGVGPDDIRYGRRAETRVLRWPLTVAPGTKTKVQSKLLDVHLAIDRDITAAWISDELSWTVEVCEKAATIPLRLTALYARDGDQWYPVFEHLSFGRSPKAHAPRGARMPDALSDPHLAEYPRGELGAPLAAMLSGRPVKRVRAAALAPPPRKPDPTLPAQPFLLGPRFEDEWRGDDALHARLGVRSIRPEDRRVGLIGAEGSVAYWVGNFLAERSHAPGESAHTTRLRGTFVFEKRCETPTRGCRPDTWFVVQGHLSQPIDDRELAKIEFGSALRSIAPLRFDCLRPAKQRGSEDGEL